MRRDEQLIRPAPCSPEATPVSGEPGQGAAVRRLQFGCGAFPAPGWINTNLEPGLGVDIRCDIREGLPLRSDSINYIASMHALCELPYLEIVPALRELRRVLKPGGVIRLGLPDLDRAIAAYVNADSDYFSIPESETASLSGKFIVQMTWYGTNLMMFTERDIVC
jgi:predicted SAM-dependent methyltransferase